MMLGSILFPAGFFLAGWTADPSIHWFPSVLGFTLIGISFLLIFQVRPCRHSASRAINEAVALVNHSRV
jgi:hypothetical protein